MSSDNIEFFPAHLKWASIICFVLISGSIAYAYVAKPDISVDQYTTEADLVGAQIADLNKKSKTDQSTESATPVQSSSQSAEPKPTVMAQIDVVEDNQPSPSHNNAPAVTPKTTASPKNPTICQEEVIGVIRKSNGRKEYFVSHLHLNAYNDLKKSFGTEAVYFCSEEQAQAAGYVKVNGSHNQF